MFLFARLFMSQHFKVRHSALLLGLILGTNSALLSQREYPTLDILSQVDSLYLQGDEREYAHFVHAVKPRETLYSIAKAYGTPMPDILEHNPILTNTTLPLGYELKIPLAFNHFESEAPATDAHNIPVYYRVSAGQTMFTIAHRILRIPLLHLMSHNQNQTNLSTNQLLLVGWIATKVSNETTTTDSTLYMTEPPVPSSQPLVETDNKRKNKTSERPTSDDPTDPVAAAKTKTRPGKMKVIKGAAHWTPSQGHRKGYFVLSRDLPKKSEVEIYNPMSRKSVFATVVGDIPPGMYQDHIVAIVSEDIAKDLSVIDQTFYMHLRYID